MLEQKTKTIIKLNDVCFGYSPNKNILFNVSFDFNSNDYVCVLGLNGSGKTTLARILSGLIKQKSGDIFLSGEVINKKNILNLKNNIGIIFENPENEFIGLQVDEEIAFGLENRCVEPNVIKERINEIATQLNIQSLLNRNVNELSGGQKQLVALASILVLEPKIIILDEATSMLDYESKKLFINYINQVRKNNNTCIINITHDIEETSNADKIVVLDNGRIILSGKPRDIFMDKKFTSLGFELPFEYQVRRK